MSSVLSWARSRYRNAAPIPGSRERKGTPVVSSRASSRMSPPSTATSPLRRRSTDSISRIRNLRDPAHHAGRRELRVRVDHESALSGDGRTDLRMISSSAATDGVKRRMSPTGTVCSLVWTLRSTEVSLVSVRTSEVKTPGSSRS